MMFIDVKFRDEFLFLFFPSLFVVLSQECLLFDLKMKTYEMIFAGMSLAILALQIGKA